MFLRQESKYNGKNRSESTFCCENPSPNHDFSSKNKQNHLFFMFFLSELPYSKSQQPTCLPRGQVAPQVYVDNCDATN